MRLPNPLFITVISSVILGCLFLLAVDVTRALTQSLHLEESSSFHLAAGSSLSGMAQALQKQGRISHIRDVRYISLIGRLSGMADRIQAGEYAINANTTPFSLLQAMVRGDVVQYNFTLVEGWNLKQVLKAISKSPHIKHSDPAISVDMIAKELRIRQQNPEGWFFPDTYSFPNQTIDWDVLRRAHAAMRTVLEEEWAQRAEGLPYKSAYEALIMASIVEKETADITEREQIAGVFVRRLKKGMRLQTDPTVIYGMGESYDGNIRRADLLRPTRYNTYTQYGLPPTPIAMPGRAAIHAALHPLEGDSLYFVSKGDGTHEFTSNLKAHNEAVRKFQLGQKAKGE